MATILVVDDDPGVLSTVTFMLQVNDHAVTAVSSVSECLSKLDTEKFELIITDILMPTTDGTELIQILRKREDAPPIIAMSGGGNIVSANDALSLAKVLAKGVLEKPFLEDELNAVINDVLGQAQTT